MNSTDFGGLFKKKKTKIKNALEGNMVNWGMREMRENCGKDTVTFHCIHVQNCQKLKK